MGEKKLIITGSQFLFGLCSLGFISSSIFTLCRVFLFSFSLLIYKKLKLTRDKTEQNIKKEIKVRGYYWLATVRENGQVFRLEWNLKCSNQD